MKIGNTKSRKRWETCGARKTSEMKQGKGVAARKCPEIRTQKAGKKQEGELQRPTGCSQKV